MAAAIRLVMFTTSNYTDLGFTLNDEVLLIMRGESMMKKFWRGIDFQSTLPPDDLTDPEDVQELDSLMAMFPYISLARCDAAQAVQHAVLRHHLWLGQQLPPRDEH